MGHGYSYNYMQNGGRLSVRGALLGSPCWQPICTFAPSYMPKDLGIIIYNK